MEINVNTRKHFTKEKKHFIVNEHISTGIPVTVLARKYEIHAITLYNWKRIMKQKSNESPITTEYIQKIIEENDSLKSNPST